VTKRRRQLRATLATALVLTPLMTPVAQANTLTHQILSAKVTAKQTKDGQPVDVKANTIEETKNQLAAGISEEKVTYKNTKGDRTVMHTVSVDLKEKTAGLYAGTPDDGKGFGLQTVRDEANAAIKSGHQVVAGLNSDFFNMGTGEPLGNVVKDGVEIHATKPDSGESFFGVTKDGEPLIGSQAEYQAKKGDLKQALGGLIMLVKDGKALNPGTQVGGEFAARSAVGIRADKSVFFVTIDGKQSPYSNGMTLAELSQTMKDQGAVDALNLDGGGSATYLSRTPGDTGLSLKNKPSDGEERKVANSWLITTTEKSDHTFDRAQVTPKDTVYTPNATINFTAKGVDKAGYDATLPDSATWTLADPSLGDIDAKTGVFKPKGKLGDVTANLTVGDKVVGSATVTIAKPDSVEFLNKKLSMKTDITESLGMKVRYKGRDVALSDGDITWEFPKELGTIDAQGNLHTAGKHAKGTVKATIAGTEISQSVEVEIGQLPTVLYDFEKGLGDWKVSGSGRGEANELGLAEPGKGQVRFGDHALEVKFDLTHGVKGSTLGAYAGPGDAKEIPGAPTALGMWVYGTPESQGLWLRSQIYDAKGTAKPLNFTDSKVGIDWLGWKYVEAPIPTSYQGPFKTFPKQVVRVMALKAGNPDGAPRTKGSIFVDNIRAVYGANVDDLKSPIVEDISVADKTFDKQGITITAKVHDDQDDPNMSGIDWKKNKIYIDGVDRTTDSTKYTFDPDGTMTLRGYQYSDGIHHVKVVAYDKFGNRTDKDTYFEMKSGNKTGVTLGKIKGDTAQLGGNATFDLTADDLTNIKNGEFTVQLGKGFPVKGVKFANDSKDNTYDYDAKTGELKLHIKDTQGSSAGKDVLAQVTVETPAETETGTSLTYQLTNGTVTFNDTSNNADMINTVSSRPMKAKIQSDYQLKVGQLIVGKAGSVTVVDGQDNPVAGVDLAMAKAGEQAEVIGKTDDKGTLTSDKLSANAGKFNLVATKGTQRSFKTLVQVFTPAKTDTPSNLLAGSTQDPATQKTITWFTNPVTDTKDAIMQVATDEAYKVDHEKAFKDYKGEQKTFTYVSDGKAIRVNSVTAKELKPGTEYAYRVGNGDKWSDVRHFKTLTDTDKLSFNVFGDTQVNSASQLADFDKIVDRLEKDENRPDFALHVGDFNDDQAIFNEADVTSEMFNKHKVYDSLDMIHVLGNHEYMGDDGSKATAMLGTPGHNGAPVNKKGTYSVDYGNMHIASLGWTDNVEEMKQELEWLRKDMQASNKTWKVVATHQPPYNKNPADSQSSMFHNMLPPVCDELGIDVVFSGHDHSYGRTKPLVAGKEDQAKGTTYVAAGHTGDKTYDILPNEPEAWDYIQKQEDKNQKVYLTVQVDGQKMKLVTKDVDGKVVDQAELKAHNWNLAAAKVALGRKLAEAKKIDLSKYTAENKEAFQKAMTTAELMSGDAGFSVGVVDATIAQLDKAKADLVADKTQLNTTIAVAEKLDLKRYTPGSRDRFTQALSEAKTISGDKKVTAEEVAKANSRLAQAQASLELDKSTLKQKLTDAQTVDLKKYTTDSQEPFKAALATADKVLKDSKATVEDIDGALDGLAKTQAALVPDKAPLEKKVKAAETIGLKKYTADSQSVFKQDLAEAKQVLDKTDATVNEIDAVIAKLVAAQDALLPDKLELGNMVKIAKHVDLKGYTADSQAPFKAALATAEKTLADAKASVDDIEDVLADLIKKQSALVPDKTELEKLVKAAEEVVLDKYTADSRAAFNQALADAKQVLAKDDATVNEIAATMVALDQAQTGLTFDTANLKAAVDSAKQVDLKGYTADSQTAFKQALDAAQAVLADSKATGKAIDNAIANLAKAKAALKLDKSQLKQKVTAAQAVNLKEYTADSQKPFVAALVKAEQVLAAEKTTVAEIEGALTDLAQAQSKLARITHISSGKAGASHQTDDKVDKAALKQKLAAAKAIDLKGYTADSQTAFKAALTQAEKVLADAKATAKDVTAVLTALAKAQADLKTESPVISEGAGDQVEATKQPSKVVAIKGLALYRKPIFSKANRLATFKKQPQMRQPEFKVLGTTTKGGHVRYHVRDINRHSKTYGKSGYITASAKFVQNAEYQKAPKVLTVISAKGLKAYGNAKLTGKVKHTYRQGQILKVKRIVTQKANVRFQLTNGQFITANKQQVQTGKHHQVKRVTTKQGLNLYRDVNLKHKLRHVAQATSLKVTGWDYSDKGVLRYHVTGGYITASQAFVK